MRISDFKKQISLEKPELTKKIERDISHQIGKMLIEARLLKGITQEKLAELVETKQPSIARIESGQSLPSLGFLQRIVEAMGLTLLPPKVAEIEALGQESCESNFGGSFDLNTQAVLSPLSISSKGLTSNNYV